MNDDKFVLTPTDFKAIENEDDNYINAKGANNYAQENYHSAMQYYHLGAAMGNVDSISNLGYCYLYGRDCEKNLSLALAYFTVASQRGSVDAMYKLGDIYSRDKWGVCDKELSLYYYRNAASQLLGQSWEEEYAILECDQLRDYPSLCFALARELMPEGSLFTNINQAYQFLLQAKAGYEIELANGVNMYRYNYENVLALLTHPVFDCIREEYSNEEPEFMVE